MDPQLKESIEKLMDEINSLPEEKKKAIASRVREIRRLTGLRIGELENEMESGDGPQGLVPCW